VTLELTFTDESVSATWKSPAAGLWVASEAGTYLGMVERIEGRYVVSDALGRDLGSFSELGDAQVALDGFTGTPLSTVRDVMLTKAIVVMTGVTAVTLALSVVLLWK
jgi:hypothetical protein